MSKTIYEVSIEANEPWTNGQRNAIIQAARRYVGADCNLQLEVRGINPADYDDVDELLNAADDDYLGIGGNVHQDADGYCFKSKTAANNFRIAVDDYGRNIGMTVQVYTHEAE